MDGWQMGMGGFDYKMSVQRSLGEKILIMVTKISTRVKTIGAHTQVNFTVYDILNK